MPAKKSKPRKISQQNREILRRNFNKKFIQLQHLIYELSSSSEEIYLQRIFIQDWFNERIDHALSVYHKQIDKLQKTSVEDFAFIVDRTDRFYQRKIKTLNKEKDENFESTQKDLNSFNNEIIQKECTEIMQIISSINNQIEKDKLEFEILFDSNQKILIEKVREEKEKGEKIISDYLQEMEEKSRLYQIEFDGKLRNIEEQHKNSIKVIQNEFGNYDNSFDNHDYQKIDLDDYKNQVFNLKEQFTQSLGQIKSQITNEINQIRISNESFQNQFNQLNKQIENNEYDQIIKDLTNEFDQIRKQNSIKLENLKQSLKELIERNKNEIETIKATSIHNQQNEGSSIDFLRNQLNSTFELVQQKILNEQQKYKSNFALLENSIKDEEKNFQDQCLQLKKESSNHKIQHQRVVVATQKSFLMETESILNKFKESIDKAKSDFLLLQTNQNQAEIDFRSNLNNLKIEKELEIQTNQKQISDFDSNLEKEIMQIKSQNESDINNFRNEMEKLLENDKISQLKNIDELHAKHKEEIENCKRIKDEFYQKQIEMITSEGYSKSEYDEINQKYREEYDSLQSQLQESRVIIPESDAFKNMLHVISDLQNEKVDHETINIGRKNCLNSEWNEKIENENKRHSQALSKLVINPRLREEAKKSLKHKIEITQKEREEAISHLNQVLAELQKKKNVLQDLDEEIDKLKSILDRLPTANEEIIQKAIKDRDQLIQDTKMKISQYPMIMNSRKKDAVFLINGQKTVYSEKSRKINESHNNFLKKNEKATRNEVNQNASKLNQMETEFQQKKLSLTNEIRSTKEKINQQISESLTQEMRDAWTQQRSELDSKVINLRNKIESELAKLKTEKEEIVKKYDKIWKDKLDMKMKLMKMASNWTTRSSDIDNLDKQAQSLTIQLTKSMNDLKKYKMMYIDQEKQNNPSLGPIPNMVKLPKNYQDLV